MGFIDFFVGLVSLPGYPLVLLLSKFKRMGDGTGNESSIIEFGILSFIFGIVSWIFILVVGAWFLSNYQFTVIHR